MTLHTYSKGSHSRTTAATGVQGQPEKGVWEGQASATGQGCQRSFSKAAIQVLPTLSHQAASQLHWTRQAGRQNSNNCQSCAQQYPSELVVRLSTH